VNRRVLVVGGGVGGLEAALALRAVAGELVDVELLAPERHFTYRPLSVAEPFGRGQMVRVEIARIAAERGFSVTGDALDSVLPDERSVITQEGTRLEYDDLVLALGAQQRVGVQGALTFRGPQDVERVAETLSELATDGDPARVAFVAPSPTTWTLPLYELALLTSAWATRRELDVRISVVTAERFPLEAFGPAASETLQRLLTERGIVVRCGSVPESFEDGGLWIPIEGRLRADLAVALPFLVGRAVRGLPQDDLGFTPVDDMCRVEGLDGVFAIGDMASHTIKQGGLAAQQADVAAAAIAAAAGAAVKPEPYRPVLRGLLLTGGTPLYLRNPPVAEERGARGVEPSSPWWPAHKVVGRHLAPYLATHGELLETRSSETIEEPAPTPRR